MKTALFLNAALSALLLGACSPSGLSKIVGTRAASLAPQPAAIPEPDPQFVHSYRPASSGRANLDGLISRYASTYGIPVSLVHRVIDRESDYNPAARNGPYYGLMQISHATAKTMGYRGPASGLLDAETNLKYAVRYLAGAYLVGGSNQDKAIRLYSRGYYYDAKRQGLLEETGLR